MKKLLLGVILALSMGVASASPEERAMEAATNIGHVVNNTLMCLSMYDTDIELESCVNSVVLDLAENVGDLAGASFEVGYAAAKEEGCE